MNPPFHTSRAADPALGQGFINPQLARNLTRNGNLWMVANRHLPYEVTLNETFRYRSLRCPETIGSRFFRPLALGGDPG